MLSVIVFPKTSMIFLRLEKKKFISNKLLKFSNVPIFCNFLKIQCFLRKSVKNIFLCDQ